MYKSITKTTNDIHCFDWIKQTDLCEKKRRCGMKMVKPETPMNQNSNETATHTLKRDSHLTKNK